MIYFYDNPCPNFPENLLIWVGIIIIPGHGISEL